MAVKASFFSRDLERSKGLIGFPVQSARPRAEDRGHGELDRRELVRRARFSHAVAGWSANPVRI